MVENMSTRPRVGISSCLLGAEVRYDGGHKRHPVVCELAEQVEWVAVCPEVGAGFQTPREPVRLQGDPGSPRLYTVQTQVDETERMARFCEQQLTVLGTLELSGYVLKSRSPSCGLGGLAVHGREGRVVSTDGVGLFARALRERFPSLPVIEETDLDDPERREAFLARVVGYRRQP
jgi:uncharacterized protein YbbK (DUF523 family)